MTDRELDDVDRGILHMLQQDARNTTASNIADAVGVAPNTVRNRIERLEENGVITGYAPGINYERAGFRLHVVFVCTVPISQRSEYAGQVLDVEGTIGVTEILSGHQNLMIEAVGDTSDEITRIASEIEQLGVEIERESGSSKTRASSHSTNSDDRPSTSRFLPVLDRLFYSLRCGLFSDTVALNRKDK